MRYQGGKTRIAKSIVGFLEGIRGHGQEYLEPFCGSFAVGRLMSGRRTASDVFKPIVTLNVAIRDGWRPPKEVSREKWLAVKECNDEEDPLTAYCGFCLSFGGAYFLSYLGVDENRCNRSYNRAECRSISKLKPLLGEVEFKHCPYTEWNPSGMLVYCDPPYINTASYDWLSEPFDHAKFWETMREWSRTNTVVISEYTAPEDFIPVHSMVAQVSFGHNGKRKPKPGQEKLFMHKNHAKLPFLCKR